jgi:type II secretory pathway pseudopilin PulG
MRGAAKSPDPGSNEAGQSLLLALFFLSFFGVFVAALLGFTSTSWLSSSSVAKQRSTTYEADSAVFGAIQRVRLASNPGTSTLCTSGTTANVFVYPSASSPNVAVGCSNPSTSAYNLTVTFTATSAPSGPNITATVVFYNSQLNTTSTPTGTYAVGSGLQAVQILKWAATP